MSVTHQILQRISFSIDVWRKSREFRGNNNYNLSLVEKGFSDRKEVMRNDSDILNRICVAYNKAIDVQRQTSPVYRPSNEWLPIYERPLKEVIGALTSYDVGKLRNIYGNFWRDPCSTGLVGLPLDMKKYYFGRRIGRLPKMLFLNDMLYRYRLWRSLVGSTHTIKDLDSPCIGNPYGCYIDNAFVKGGSDYQHYYATLIGRLLKGVSSKCVVELGAGFGGMAYYLLRDQKKVSYIDFDLPENAALTAYYLLKAFPERVIKLFGEVDSLQNSIHNNEILIMPSFEIEQLSAGCAGLVFNSYSLAEMSRDAITRYIAEFARIVCGNGHFLHVNHGRDSLVVADNFGVDSDQFDLLYKIPALWNMGRNSWMDEYEYLYRKVAET